jgi:hypothetical protein
MSDYAFFNLPIRLAKILLNYQPEARVGMKISLSQSELAEMAGGTREKVNRCLCAASGHHRIEKSLDHYSQTRSAASVDRIDVIARVSPLTAL